MLTEQQSFIHRYLATIWGKKDLSLLQDIFSSDAIIHSAAGDMQGIAVIENALRQWYTAFPDIRLLLLGVFEHDDRIVVQWSASGVHQGLFMGVNATFLPIRCGGVSIYRLQEGKVIEYWNYMNHHQILQQLLLSEQQLLSSEKLPNLEWALM